MRADRLQLTRNNIERVAYNEELIAYDNLLESRIISADEHKVLTDGVKNNLNRVTDSDSNIIQNNIMRELEQLNELRRNNKK